MQLIMCIKGSNGSDLSIFVFLSTKHTSDSGPGCAVSMATSKVVEAMVKFFLYIKLNIRVSRCQNSFGGSLSLSASYSNATSRASHPGRSV